MCIFCIRFLLCVFDTCAVYASVPSAKVLLVLPLLRCHPSRSRWARVHFVLFMTMNRLSTYLKRQNYERHSTVYAVESNRALEAVEDHCAYAAIVSVSLHQNRWGISWTRGLYIANSKIDIDNSRRRNTRPRSTYIEETGKTKQKQQRM